MNRPRPNTAEGFIIILILVWGSVAIMIIAGFVGWVGAQIRSARSAYYREQAIEIAEAGIEYYRWHLAHAPGDYRDGTNHSGPYIHDYYDTDGNRIGQFVLTITPPTGGISFVTLTSEGRIFVPLNNTTYSRKIGVRMSIPSWAKYSVLSNSFLGFGSGEEIFGEVHSNGGIHFDGVAHNLVTSAVTIANDPDHIGPDEHGIHTHKVTATGALDPLPPAALPTRPDIFGAGRQMGVPPVDFTTLSGNLATLKTRAQSDGIYFPNSGGQGYHVVLRTDDTFDLYRVDSKIALAEAPPSNHENATRITQAPAPQPVHAIVPVPEPEVPEKTNTGRILAALSSISFPTIKLASLKPSALLGGIKLAIGIPDPTFDFALTNQGDKITIQGGSVANTITVTYLDGPSAPVAFTISGLPAGAGGSFTPTSCTPGPTCVSTLTVTTLTTTPAGDFMVTVTGTSGAIVRTTTFKLTIVPQPAFNFAMSNNGNVSANQGSSVNNTVSVSESGLVGAQNGSISVWMKPTGASPTIGNLYNMPAAVADRSGSIGIHRGITGGQDRIWAYNWDGNEDRVGVAYTAGQWTHITWVHSNGTLYLYKDGTLAGSTASGNTSVLTGILDIGHGYSATTYFGGEIDDVRMYDRALTAGEVATIYNATSDPASPTMHWKFNEGSGAIAADSSGNNVTGFLTGSPTWGPGQSGMALTFNGTSQYVTTNRGVAAAPGSVGFSSPGLVGYWSFEDPALSGTTALDVSGQGNNGQLTNMPSPTQIPGSGGVGEALTFDGLDDYMLTPIRATPTFTWSAWIRVTSFAAGYGTIMSSPDSNYMLMDVYNNTLSVWSPDGLGGHNLGVTGLNTNTWYHLVFVREGNSITNGYKAYLNGAFTGQFNTGVWNPNGSIVIGGRLSPAPIQFLNGAIDDPRIYNRALTTQEIAQLYGQGPANFSGGGTINLTETLPPGVTASFSPVSCSPNANCGGTISLSVSSSTPLGTYPITVTGKSGSVAKTTTFDLTVTMPPPFNYNLTSAGAISVTRGSAVNNIITATLTAGVPSSAAFSVSGLPSGASASFAPTACFPTCSTTMSISTIVGSATGTFPITVTSLAGGITRTTVFNLTINDPPPLNFSLANGGPRALNQGESTNNVITATYISGTVGSVIFSASGLPTGVDAVFSPLSCTPVSGSPCSTTVTFTASMMASTGSFLITIYGTNNSTIRTTTFLLDVGSFGGGAAPTVFSLTNSGDRSVVQGSNITNTITATLTSGNPSAVTFTTSGLPTGANASYSPSSCVPSPSCGTTMTITTLTSTPADSYVIIVTGTAGSTSRTTSFTLTVTPLPPLNFSLTNGGNKSVFQGSTRTNTVTATYVSGTNAAVNLSVSGLPADANASFNPGSSCTPNCTVTMTITTLATTPDGVHTITVTGVSGATTRTTVFTLTVNVPPPFDFTISSGGNRSVSQGSNVTGVNVASANVAPDALLYWTLDEASGPAAGDNSGNNNSGTLLNGPTWTSPGKIGGGLSFDGVNDSISAPSVTWTPGVFTISFWLNPLSRINYNQGINSTIGWGGFVFHTAADGSLYVGTDVATRFNPTQLPANTLTLNSWQHFTFSFDNGTGRFYKNGVLLASRVGMTYPVGWGGFTVASVHGKLDDLRIYGRRLGDDEILDLAATAPPPVAPPTDPVIFSIAGLPTGTSASFAPDNCVASPTCGVSLTIDATGAAPTGAYPITVTGSSQGLTRNKIFTLTVNPPPALDFSLANGGARTVNQGSSVSNTVTATYISGTNGQIGFTVSGLPAGANASFSPTSCMPSPTCTTTITINTDISTPLSTYTITVTGTAGPTVKTTAFTLQVNAAPVTCMNIIGEPGWGSWSIGTETRIPGPNGNLTFPFPPNGLMFLEDDTWVNGMINGARITIATGHFPETSSTDRNIIVNDNIRYTNFDGTDVIGLIAQGYFRIGFKSADDLTIQAAIIAKNGGLVRNLYPQQCGVEYQRTHLTFLGAQASNLRSYFSHTGSGYLAQVTNYDANLLYYPPPFFPLASNQFTILSWDEIY